MIQYEVEWDEILTKDSQNWLDDKVVNSFFKVLFHENQLIDSLLSAHVNYLINKKVKLEEINQEAWKRRKSKTRGEVADYLSSLGSAIDRLEGEIYYWPYHKDDHWILYEINLIDKTIYIYDSFGLRSVTNDIAIWIQSLFSHFKSEILTYKPVITKPKQRDTFQCGVWICLFAYLRRFGMTPEQVNGNTKQRSSYFFRPKMLEILKRFDSRNPLPSLTPHQSNMMEGNLAQGTISYLLELTDTLPNSIDW